MNTTTNQSWDLEIKPQESMFNLHLKDVWRYRDLLLLLVRRDFVSFYKQTILGPLWFFIQPLFTTIIYSFIFGNLAGISTEEIPAPLFYLVGITAWNYFADCLTKTSTVFKDNANIFGKVYFPRLIMPLSIVISNLVRFVVQLILLLLMMSYFHWIKGNESFHITSYLLLFPVCIVLMAMLGLGIGMTISALTTKYRDLSFLVTFGVQLLMYGTTVVYPLSVVLSKYPKYSWLVKANPMTEIIEISRLGFLGQGTFSIQLFAATIAATILMLVFGIIIFNKVEKTFVDTV